MTVLRRVVVRASACAAVRRGHPWVWGGAIESGLTGAAAGDEVQIVDAAGATVGRGVADPDSPLAIRAWTTSNEAVDETLVRSRVDLAFALRRRLFGDGKTTAYRLLHGEGDRCPGYVVDRYGDVAVLRVDGAGAVARLPKVRSPLEEALKSVGVRTFVHRPSDSDGAVVLFGPAPPDRIEVREHDVPFLVDLARGQKTGAFLDQRENRRRVGALAGGRRVLNLFSYAGGFSQRAALGGATHVTSVDSAAAAHATAQASFRAAGLDPRAHSFVTADAFAFIADAKKKRERWDLVVSDPPSFAPNEKSVARALTAYRSLHRACADVLAPGGIFCAASCSSHVPMELFLSTLDDAATGSGTLRVVETHGPPADHPTIAAWPEGRYLKLVVLA
jgi:23S rRNA (cytosine1962-C5)-methyltransferase